MVVGETHHFRKHPNTPHHSFFLIAAFIEFSTKSLLTSTGSWDFVRIQLLQLVVRYAGTRDDQRETTELNWNVMNSE